MSPLASQASSSPAQSVTTPPASVTRRAPAATSQEPRPISKKPSKTPAAVQARSRLAAPARRRSSQRQEGAFEHPAVVVEAVLVLEREAGVADGRGHRPVGDPDRAPVPEGAAAPHGGEGLAAEQRGVDGARPPVGPPPPAPPTRRPPGSRAGSWPSRREGRPPTPGRPWSRRPPRRRRRSRERRARAPPGSSPRWPGRPRSRSRPAPSMRPPRSAARNVGHDVAPEPGRGLRHGTQPGEVLRPQPAHADWPGLGWPGLGRAARNSSSRAGVPAARSWRRTSGSATTSSRPAASTTTAPASRQISRPPR